MSACAEYTLYASFTLGITASDMQGTEELVTRKGGVKRYYTYILTRLGIP